MATSRTTKTDKFSVIDPTQSTSGRAQDVCDDRPTPSSTVAPTTFQDGETQSNGGTTSCKSFSSSDGVDRSSPEEERSGSRGASLTKGDTTRNRPDGSACLSTSASGPSCEEKSATDNADNDHSQTYIATTTDDLQLPVAATSPESDTRAPGASNIVSSSTAPSKVVEETTLMRNSGSNFTAGALHASSENDNNDNNDNRKNADNTDNNQTQEEQQDTRSERRELARQANAEFKRQGPRKRRWGRNRNKKNSSTKSSPTPNRVGRGGNGRNGGGDNSSGAPDLFDQWLGERLTGWRDMEAVTHGGGIPPVESGLVDEVDFDPSNDEIAFPPSLSALQRRQVHGWAMQLALFHASSGEDTQRHVIVSKTGVFHGKLLTRGGRTWYKEGVTAPSVERFALQAGHDEAAKPIVAALYSYHRSVQLREPGFVEWLEATCPDPLDGSDISQAREALEKWPLLEDGKWEYVDTPHKLSSLVAFLQTCKEFGFDLEAHNARTYHGLTCLLQISTVDKDFVVDPLAEGMWGCMSMLRKPFGNPDILKIGHAIRSCDVPSLYRDFGIVIINAIDTEEAAHALGEKHTGLAKVLENAGVKEQHDIAGLKQAMQACDWRERPLSPEKLTYARCDSHYLIPLWGLTRARLLGADTFASREDARQEREMQEIKRSLDAAQNEKESRWKRQQLPVSSDLKAGNGGVRPPSVVADPGSVVDATGQTEPRGSGAVSPVLNAEEGWAAEWDDPEDCHRRARSRSGSFFKTDLESINESEYTTDVGRRGSGAALGGEAFGSDELAAAFDEDDEEDMGTETGATGFERSSQAASEGASPIPAANGSVDESIGSLSAHNDVHEEGWSVQANGIGDEDIGENADEHEAASDDDEGDEDEDEDLWEGWGEEAPDDNASATGIEEKVSGSTKHEATGDDKDAVIDTPAIPAPTASVVASDDTAAAQEKIFMSNGIAGSISNESSTSAFSTSSAPTGGSRGKGICGRRGARSGSKRSRKLGKDPPVLEHDQRQVVLTDGVRLMWKALSRTQLAAVVLWKPAPEAKREDSHNERHFRTAVQRLTPPRWSEINVRVYEDIYLWRDRTARRMDDGAAYVCPGDILIDVALAMPKTLEDLRRVSAPLSPVLGDADTAEALELVKVVRVALGLPEEGGGRIGDGSATRNVAGRIRRGDASSGRRTRILEHNRPVVVIAIASVAALGIIFALSKRRKP